MLHKGELAPGTFACAWCGEENTILLDPGQGRRQQLVEDCRVCCRPNVLYIRLEPATGRYEVRAERESD